MTAPLHERPSIPLTWAEQDRFEVLAVSAACRTTRYYTPRARLRLLARRVARSPFADDLRASARAAFWPAVIGAGLLLGLYLLWVTRGSYVTWSGFEPIPTGGKIR